MTGWTFGNGLIDERNYDLQGQLTEQRLNTGTGSIINRRTYQYDKNSNMLSRDTTPQNSLYRYNALDRLIHESQNQLPLNDYRYDLYGYRLETPSASDNETYRYLENSNRLDHTETLDNSGNILAEKPERELIYNDAGRLFQLIEDGVPRAEYRYTDQGLRTRKTLYQADGITVQSVIVYHYDPIGQLITETTETRDPIKDYIRLEGMTPVAQIDYNPSTNRESIRYLYTDHLDTPRLATDRNQAVVWR
ncbi:MAG: hypothetical protein ACRERU_03730 [Methylococcales bacterium]